MKNFNFKKLLTILIFAFLFCNSIFSQTYNIGTANNTSITTCSGTLVDDGGSTGNYGNNKDYKVTICSGSTDHVRLDFSKISLEIASGGPYDYITIYDGNSTAATQIAQLASLNLSSPFIPTYISSGSCLTIRFRSDGSSVAAGFEAAISCVPNNDIKLGDVASITGCSGIITDEGGSNGNYTNNLNKTTTICSGSSDFVKLEFLKNIKIKGDDKLIVFDGNSTASPSLIQISGNGTDVDNSKFFDQMPIQSTGNCITIQFVSNGANVSEGFTIQYSCTNTPLKAPGNFCSNAPTLCSLNGFQGITSSLYSPNFPGGFCGSNTNTCTDLGDASIENNSWISFIANATSVTLNFAVRTLVQLYPIPT